MAAQSWETSTHARNWVYSAARLSEMRTALRQSAVANYAAAQAKLAPRRTGTPEEAVPSIEEDALLHTNFERQGRDVCDELDTKYKGQASCTQRTTFTALMYFKRFFLKVSTVEEDPKHVMLAALFLAGKVEEEKIDVDDLLKWYGPKNFKQENLLALELRLLEALSFQLYVFSPYRSVVGFLQDVHQRCADSKSADVVHAVQQLQTKSTQLIGDILCSDLLLLYSPQQIALAVLRRVARHKECSRLAGEVETWLTSLFGSLEGEHPSRGNVLQQLATIDEQIGEVLALHSRLDTMREQLKAIDARRKGACKLVKAYAAAEEQERRVAEQEEAERRKRTRRLEQERQAIKQEEAECTKHATTAVEGSPTAAPGEPFSLRKRRRTDDAIDGGGHGARRGSSASTLTASRPSAAPDAFRSVET